MKVYTLIFFTLSLLFLFESHASISTYLLCHSKEKKNCIALKDLRRRTILLNNKSKRDIKVKSASVKRQLFYRQDKKTGKVKNKFYKYFVDVKIDPASVNNFYQYAGNKVGQKFAFVCDNTVNGVLTLNKAFSWNKLRCDFPIDASTSEMALQLCNKLDPKCFKPPKTIK